MKLLFKVLGGVILSTLVSHAALLNPGNLVPSVFQPDPTGGTQIANQVAPFSSEAFAGTVTSSVISGDPSNPFGGLTFTYWFQLSSGPHMANQFTVSSFTGYQVDASYFAGGALPVVNPALFSRSGDGAVVRFWFSPEVAVGQQSALLVVQTDANQYVNSLGGIIDGVGTDVATFAPAVIPEPSVLGLGLLGLACLLRRKV